MIQTLSKVASGIVVGILVCGVAVVAPNRIQTDRVDKIDQIIRVIAQLFPDVDELEDKKLELSTISALDGHKVPDLEWRLVRIDEASRKTELMYGYVSFDRNTGFVKMLNIKGNATNSQENAELRK